ncbi:MAG: prolyl oligopeptidase family serine peptidase [Marinobacterium sp.]|nr:prolyl oligopeptidase family serine peptidase [Marinobacterium sp.]
MFLCAVRWWLMTVLLLSGPVFAVEYSAGFVRVEPVSADNGQSFPLVVIYPTQAEARPAKLGPFTLEVALGADIADGRFPLAVISHGSGGSQLGYRSIAIDLAKRGFVVALPLHPGNNFRDNRAAGSVANWTNRPKHIAAAIDHLLAAGRFSASIDAQKVVVIGHSAGGYSALAVAGGVADTGQIHVLCQQPAAQRGPFCEGGRGPAEPATVIHHQRDTRVKALVLMAPVGVLYRHQQSLAQVELPVLLLRAEYDAELLEPYHADVIAQHLPATAKLTHRMVKNAGHYSFIAPFPAFLAAELGMVAQDPPGFDRTAFHRQLGGEIADYLQAVW